MEVSQPSFPAQPAEPEAPPPADPRLQPTPDYGSLGPGSDFHSAGTDNGPVTRLPASRPVRPGPILAVAIGVLFGVLGVNVDKANAAWSRLANLVGSRASADSQTPASVQDLRQLDHLPPQKQAEALLELAVGSSDGAVDQISSRVDRWQGNLQWNSQIATLTTVALNSSDMRVRESGIEVELAAYGLGKNSASLDYLMRTVKSTDHAQKIWALWALGLMGNRGVGTGRVVKVLTAHLKDADQDSRQWAVQGLSLVGTPEAIPLLLGAMHDDPAPTVREAAACGIASSGMFTSEHRFAAVPQLLSDTDDPALDAQTHAWAFQALAEITHQRLPNNSAAWREWYENRN